MFSLQIKRQRDPNVDSKQLLRAHIDRLPAEEQHEFITLAFRLIAKRTDKHDAERGASPSAYAWQ
jgi:hypothetical protein